MHDFTTTAGLPGPASDHCESTQSPMQQLRTANLEQKQPSLRFHPLPYPYPHSAASSSSRVGGSAAGCTADDYRGGDVAGVAGGFAVGGSRRLAMTLIGTWTLTANSASTASTAMAAMAADIATAVTAVKAATASTAMADIAKAATASTAMADIATAVTAEGATETSVIAMNVATSVNTRLVDCPDTTWNYNQEQHQ